MSQRQREHSEPEPGHPPTVARPSPESGSARNQSWRSAARSSPGAQVALELLGRRIRRLRESLSLSQQTAAGRAEIDPKHWQVIEQGGTNPTVASLVAISRALKVRLSDLFHTLPRTPRNQEPVPPKGKSKVP